MLVSDGIGNFHRMVTTPMLTDYMGIVGTT